MFLTTNSCKSQLLWNTFASENVYCMEEVKTLGYMLGRTLRIFLNQAAIEFKNREIELTFEQFVMLRMIESDPTLIQQDIANHLQKDKSIIVRQMDNLIEKQYVVRVPNSDDKRKKNLVLTQKGREMMTKIMQLNFEVSQKLISGIGENEYKIFQQVLNKIQENGGSAEDLFNVNRQRN